MNHLFSNLNVELAFTVIHLTFKPFYSNVNSKQHKFFWQPKNDEPWNHAHCNFVN